MDLDRCGVLFANGTTGDVNCRVKLPYVCFALATASAQICTSESALGSSSPEPSPAQAPTEPNGTTATSTSVKPTPVCEGLGKEAFLDISKMEHP